MQECFLLLPALGPSTHAGRPNHIASALLIFKCRMSIPLTPNGLSLIRVVFSCVYDRHGAVEAVGHGLQKFGLLYGGTAVGDNTGDAGGDNLLLEIRRGSGQSVQRRAHGFDRAVARWQHRVHRRVVSDPDITDISGHKGHTNCREGHKEDIRDTQGHKRDITRVSHFPA